MKSLIRTKSLIYILLGTALILLVPLVAMRFTDEVDWGLGDFAIVGVLLVGTGLVYELVARRSRYRVAIGIALVAMLSLVWAELAVGIFGTPFAGQ